MSEVTELAAARVRRLALLATAVSGALAVPCVSRAQDAAPWEARMTAGRIEHRVDAGFGVGASSGTVLGVAARMRRWSSVELDVHAWGGQLDADEIARDDRKVGELGLQASVPAMPWLALVASATLRGVDAAPAVQRWTMLGAGAELRFGFADGALQSVVRATLLPVVTVSGGIDPDVGFGSGVGLRLQHRRLHATLEYAVERYGFPSASGLQGRREQLSGLQLGVGARW